MRIWAEHIHKANKNNFINYENLYFKILRIFYCYFEHPTEIDVLSNCLHFFQEITK